MRRCAVIALAFFAAAHAAEPDEILADPALEARAEKLDEQLRCVVCQSQSIAESNADLAKDMRLLVRERIMAGDSDDAVVAYLVDRYGDYVLLRPPVQGNTLALWLFPAAILLVAAAGGFFYVRRMKRASAPAALTDEEKAALDAVIDERAP